MVYSAIYKYIYIHYIPYMDPMGIFRTDALSLHSPSSAAWLVSSTLPSAPSSPPGKGFPEGSEIGEINESGWKTILIRVRIMIIDIVFIVIVCKWWRRRKSKWWWWWWWFQLLWWLLYCNYQVLKGSWWSWSWWWWWVWWLSLSPRIPEMELTINDLRRLQQKTQTLT